MRDPIDNVLVQVETFQEVGVKILATQNPIIHKADKKFIDFENFTGNLGTSVKYEKPPLFVGVESLDATFEGISQRYQNINITNQFSLSYSYDTEQLLYNDLDNYMKRCGLAAMKRIGNKVGSDVATLAVTNTYRAYGDGLTPLNSELQYAQMITDFTDYGDPGGVMAFVNHVDIPPVIADMANKFAPRRNDEVVQSWDLGNFSGCDFYRTNLLATHSAGVAGDEQTLLTITAVASDGSTLTLSGAGSTTNAALQYDILTLDVDGAGGLFWLIFGQYIPCSQKVQVAIKANADSSGDSLTVSIFPHLVSQIDHPTNANQNINLSLADLVGLHCKLLPSHRAGFITGENSLFLAMPKMPNKFPWASSNKQDDSGAFMRQYYGSIFDRDVMGFVNDTVYGFDLIFENSMRIVYPLSPQAALSLAARKRRKDFFMNNPNLKVPGAQGIYPGQKVARVKPDRGLASEDVIKNGKRIAAPPSGGFIESADRIA